MPLPQTNLTILMAHVAGSPLGFPASAVHEILRAVAIAPLPGAPDVIEGVINLRGQIIPVLDIRHRFALSPVALSPEQFLIVLAAQSRLIAVRVDDVDEMVEVEPTAFQAPSLVSPLLERMQGVAATDNGAVVVYDVDSFLSQSESEALDLRLAATS